MAPRIAPTADELAELLAQFLAEKPETFPGAIAPVSRDVIAVPMDTFFSYARAKLKTTAMNARRWLKDVAVADGAPFRIIQARHGVPTYQLVPRRDPKSAFLYENERMGWFDNFATDATPRLTDYGVLNKTMGSTGDQFIIPTATLTNLVIEAAKRHEEIRAQQVADRAAELDAIEADHGEGIALLRGLLHAADIPRNSSTLNIRRHSFFEGTETSTHVSVDLTGAQVDALAPVLRELGVKARFRKRAGNAETDLKRAPVKTADAAAE